MLLYISMLILRDDIFFPTQYWLYYLLLWQHNQEGLSYCSWFAEFLLDFYFNTWFSSSCDGERRAHKVLICITLWIQIGSAANIWTHKLHASTRLAALLLSSFYWSSPLCCSKLLGKNKTVLRTYTGKLFNNLPPSLFPTSNSLHALSMTHKTPLKLLVITFWICCLDSFFIYPRSAYQRLTGIFFHFFLFKLCPVI